MPLPQILIRSARRGGLCALLVLASASPAAAAGSAATTVVDRPAGLGAPHAGFGNAGSLGLFGGGGGDSVSGDAAGRWVVFTSRADSLLAPSSDDGGGEHVYELDRQTGIVIPVSLDNAGNVVDGEGPSVSRDGTKVAFMTRVPIDAVHDTNNALDAYVRYLATGQTILVSRGAGAAAPAARVYEAPRIDANGDHVAFVTPISLDGADGNAKADVYLRNLAAATTTLISRATGAAGVVGGGESGEPSPSADSSTVAFTSRASNLDSGDDANGAGRDVFVRRPVAGTTDLVSMRSTLTGGGDDDAYEPDLSPTGNTVAFTSEASDLNAAADGTYPQVFRRQITVAGSPTVLVSQAGGVAGDRASGDASIAVAGGSTYVAFRSSAGNLDPAKTGSDTAIFLADGPVRLVSRGPGPAGAPLTLGGAYRGNLGSGSRTIAYESGDGALVADSGDFGHVFVRDMADLAQPQSVVDHAPSSAAPTVDGGGDSSLNQAGRAMSADGRFVVFVSQADALLGFGSPLEHAFRRDLVTGETILVDRADGAAGAPGTEDVVGAVLSDDGNVIAFTTTAALDPADTNSAYDVYVRDIAAGTTRLGSRGNGMAGAIGDKHAGDPALSGDGTRLAWSTGSTNLGDGGLGGGHDDVHLRVLASGQTLLVSRADGGALVAGNGSSSSPSVNTDGTVVAFDTSATNLGDGDTDNGSDVHVRNLAAGTTRLASRAAGVAGAHGNNSSSLPSLSADGTRVAFESYATNLIPGDADAFQDVYVRDLATADTLLVSRADGAAGAKGGATSRSAAISADGTMVGFESFSTMLVATATPGDVSQVYVRDLGQATTTLASRAGGAGGAPADDSSAFDAQLDRDGSCVAFTSRARSIALGAGVSSDFTRIYRRAVTDRCPFPAPAADTPAPDPAPGPGGPGTTPTARPAVTRARLTRTRFRVGTRPTATSARITRRAPIGTRIDVSLSAAATVRLTLTRAVPGRRVGRRCAKATARLRRRKPCTRLVAAGTLRRSGRAGVNRFAFSGRIGRRALPAGSYRLTVVATNAGGRSAARTLRFRVVRR